MARKCLPACALFLALIVTCIASPGIASAHSASPPSAAASANAPGAAPALAVAATTETDWSTYGFSNARDGFNSADAVSASNASGLKLRWTHTAAGSIFSQPVVDSALGLVYWGSWDGYEHATNIATNAYVWARYLGVTTDNNCGPASVGVASTATVGAIGSTPVVFVGGGKDQFFALNATNGQVIWSTTLGSSPNHFLWSSPAYYNGSIYIGNTSFGDCPLVSGQLIQLNASTGAIQHTFQVVSSACTGGGIWGSPTIDTVNGFVYFATGNPGTCSSAFTEAVVKVSAANVTTVFDSWQPRGPDGADLDFGSTPALFTATINGVTHSMLGIGNKDGQYYALDRNAMHSGPLWHATIASAGSCPQCGSGTISPAAWDGSRLYVAGGHTSINGVTCAGSLSALSPSGSFIWRHCMQDGPVLGAVSVSGSPGVALVGQGRYLMGIRTSDGATIFRFLDLHSGSNFWGSPSVSGGGVFIGNMDGNLYSLGL